MLAVTLKIVLILAVTVPVHSVIAGAVEPRTT
jgi:hypothetical protein